MERSKAASSVAIALLLSGCGYSAKGPLKIATVNQHVLTQSDLTLAVRSSAVIDPSTRSSGPKANVHLLVQQWLVKDWATRHHVISTTVADHEATHFIDTNITPRLGGPSGLARALQKNKISSADFHRFVANQMILEAVFARVTAHVAPVKSGQGYAFYRAHQSMFVTPHEKLAREILVSSQKSAMSLETQLKKGANFSALARRDSKDTATATTGGSLGWIKVGVVSSLPAAVAHSIAGLAPGHYSIVPTRLGYAILEVETEKPGHLIPYSQVRPEIEAQLAHNLKTSAFQAWANRLEKTAHVKLYQNG